MRTSTIWADWKKRMMKWALRGAVLLFWLGVWALLSRGVAREILLPSPGRTLSRLLELAVTAPFWRTVLSTCLRVAGGFASAAIAGTALAVLCAALPPVRVLLQPLLEVIRSTPVASFIILALVWIKSAGHLPAFVAFLMVVPMVWANVVAGIGGTDRELLEMARLFRFSPWTKLRAIYLPQVAPHFAAACSTGLGFAWKSAIAAEVIAHPPRAMGMEIYNAKIYLETTDLFAWTVAVIVLSAAMERIAALGARRVAVRGMGRVPAPGSPPPKLEGGNASWS